MIDYLLPGDWRDLRIHDPVDSERAIRSYARDTVGPRDDLAGVRRDLVEQLTRTADSARSAGAVAVHMALEAVPGVPLPVNLMVHLVPTTVTDADQLLDRVRAMPDGQPGVRECLAVDVDRIELTETTWAVVRTRRLRSVGSVVDEATTVAETLKLEYWLPSPARDRVALFTFSTSVTDLEPALVELCAAIVVTASWHAAPGPAESD